ncbi:hypothetical protein V6N13_011405 [Hibiscus sabdariffa]|uniref:SLC26A/SulP transporter domain-containing protein n=1 Tax=Hibiscus sabdariffa TaxID=183260 RepID=A0ABR2SCS6_9ROSI
MLSKSDYRAIKIIQNVTYEATTFLTDMLSFGLRPPHSSKGHNKLQTLDLRERKCNVRDDCTKHHFDFIVNYTAGAQIAVPSIVLAAAVLVTLQFLLPLFYYTPNIILAAIIITAVMGLIDYQAAYKLWKVDKLDFLACISSFFGVRFIPVPRGLAIAVSILNFSK